jgi:hypothetical protein
MENEENREGFPQENYNSENNMEESYSESEARENIVREISPRKLRKAPVLEAEELSKGYFIRLKKFPIDDTNPKDIKIQAKANKYLGL